MAGRRRWGVFVAVVISVMAVIYITQLKPLKLLTSASRPAWDDRLQSSSRDSNIIPRTDIRTLVDISALTATFKHLSLLQVDKLTPLQKPAVFNSTVFVAAADGPTFTVPIYIHDFTDYGSDCLYKSHTWEFDQLRDVLRLLKNEDLDLIDMGANIGVYTLSAAKLGRQVLAVEPYRENFIRLGLAVLDQHFESRVTIVCNLIACCNKRYVVSPRNADMGTLGIDYTREADNDTCGQLPPTEVCVQARYPDDLVPVVKFRRALLKMDIEAHEGVAFEEAAKLFNTVQIPYIVMEWMHVQRQNTKFTMFDFLIGHGYIASLTPHGDALNVSMHEMWPEATNIWWRLHAIG